MRTVYLIVIALALNLTGKRTAKQQPDNTQAYDLFLQGWAHYQRHTAGDSASAGRWEKSSLSATL